MELLYCIIEVVGYGIFRFGGWKDGKVAVITGVLSWILSYYSSGVIEFLLVVIGVISIIGLLTWRCFSEQVNG